MSFDGAFRARLRDLLAWRRDVRRFLCDPLPDGALEVLIEFACLAPSVGLSQPWRFVIVEDHAVRAAIRENFAACNAQALAAQNEDAGLRARFAAVAAELTREEARIVGELSASQGKPVQIGGYYHPDPVKCAAAMRPSATFNRILAALT